jgi:hypothetical protein
MNANQEGRPTWHLGELVLTHGATPGWYRLAMPGIATHLSVRAEDVRRYILVVGDGQAALPVAGYHKNAHAVKLCPYCGLPRMDDVPGWTNRRSDAQYSHDKCKDLYHQENHETGLRGADARERHQGQWRYSVVVDPLQAKKNGQRRRRPQEGDEG